MPSSVKQMYAIAAGVSLLALLGFVFTPHVFAAWVDAPNDPPTYGAAGCSPFPCLEDDFKPVTQTAVSQSKQGKLAIGTSADPYYPLDVAGDVNTTGLYRVNGIPLTQGGGSIVSGNGTQDYLSKWTSGFALGNSLVFDNGTNVGIGTETFSVLPPGETNKLEVAGAVLGQIFFDRDDTDYFLDPGSGGSGNLAGTLTTQGLRVTGVINTGTLNTDTLNARTIYDRDNTAYYLDPASSASGNLAGALTTGGINTGTLRVTGGTPATGNVLTSDASGNAAWTAPVVPTNYWTLSGTDIYSNNTGNVGIGTQSPMRQLHLSGTNVVEMVMGVTDGLANYRLWNFVVDGPAGTAKNFYIRQLNDAGTGGNVPFSIQGSTGNVSIGGTVNANGGYVGLNGGVLTPHYVNGSEDTYTAYGSYVQCDGQPAPGDSCDGVITGSPISSCAPSETRAWCIDTYNYRFIAGGGYCHWFYNQNSGMSCLAQQLLSVY